MHAAQLKRWQVERAACLEAGQMLVAVLLEESKGRGALAVSSVAPFCSDCTGTWGPGYLSAGPGSDHDQRGCGCEKSPVHISTPLASRSQA